MPTAKLIINEPGQRARAVRVTGLLTSIGRERDNNVRLVNDTHVSRYHVTIENRDGEFWVSDIGSVNGTSVNGEPLLTPRQLVDGDLIRLGGSSTLEFHLGSERPAADLNKTEFIPAVTPPTAPPTAPPPVMPPGPPPTTKPLKPPVEPVSVNKFPTAYVVGSILILSAGIGLASLFAAGVIKWDDSTVADNRNAPPVGEVTTNDNATPTPEASQPPASPVETQPPPSGEAVQPPTATSEQDQKRERVKNLASALAAQITGRSNEVYKFDPLFVETISKYVDEYKGAPGYSERARKYTAYIYPEFTSSRIMPAVMAYILAMSQTKFMDNHPGGVWNLPPSIVSGISEANPDMRDPAISTSIAARHMSMLFDTFGLPDFMYAVACYGTNDAGKLQEALERADPEHLHRSDFWKMKNARVLNAEQVERVARFFAAGIVCENPREFGLKDKAFSSLF